MLSFREGDLPSKGWLKDSNASRAALANLAAALAQPPLAPVGDVREELSAFDITKPISVDQDGALAVAVLDRFAHSAGPLTTGDAKRIVEAIQRLRQSLAALQSSTSAHVPEGYAEGLEAAAKRADYEVELSEDNIREGYDLKFNQAALKVAKRIAAGIRALSAAPGLQAGEDR